MPISERRAIVGHAEGGVEDDYGAVMLEGMFMYLKSLKIAGMPF